MTIASFARPLLSSANPQLVIGGTVLGVLILTAVFAPWLAPHDPLEQDLFAQHLPPFWLAGSDPAYPLGTDNLGRDVLSRMIWGVRPVLIVMLVGATFSGAFGSLVGLLAGYFGGWTDTLVSRTIDVFLSFPPILLAIVLVAVIGPGLDAVIMAVILIGWTRFARVVRGEALVLREQDFVTSARVLGFSRRRILFSELLLNVFPIIISLLALEMGRAIVVEAILAFIGFSASNMATWGGVIADGRSYIHQAWWVMTLPILAIMASVLSLSLLADGLRQTIDPVVRR